MTIEVSQIDDVADTHGHGSCSHSHKHTIDLSLEQTPPKSIEIQQNEITIGDNQEDACQDDTNYLIEGVSEPKKKKKKGKNKWLIIFILLLQLTYKNNYILL